MKNNDDIKIKYLDILSEIIDRMSRNSFIIKGWSISIVVAIVTLVPDIYTEDEKSILVLLLSIIIFSLLDAKYLHLERIYRDHWNNVIKDSNFDLVRQNINNDMKDYSYISSYLSWSIMLTYGGLLFVGVVMLI